MGIYQNNEPVEIVVDDRERESDVIDCLRSIPAVSVRIDRLPLGDYQANRGLSAKNSNPMALNPSR